jgi:hypothetical protein
MKKLNRELGLASCQGVTASAIISVQRHLYCVCSRGSHMSRHYSTRDFFLRMPNGRLARYFIAPCVLADLDFAAMKETQPKELFSAWLALPEQDRNSMDAEFREIYGLSSEKGWCAIRDEADWQLREMPRERAQFVGLMAELNSHYERAMVTFLDYKQFWKGATLFCHADTLSYWRKRKGFPQMPASVHEDGRKALAEGIGNYFHQTEGRGRNCVVEAFRRGELDYFCAYPEDYSQQSLEWVDGEFGRRPHNPAFEVIYVYSEKDGELDLNCRGTYRAAEPLQAIFASEILKLPELPPDLTDERVYDLSPLSQRSFQFVYDPASGIQSVTVKKLRLSSKIVKGDRITLEADSAARPDAIYGLLDRLGPGLRLSTYNVTQVELAALVVVKRDEKPASFTVRVTHPNSCSLKYDDVDLTLREMLIASGIEPREPNQSLELAGMETAQP